MTEIPENQAQMEGIQESAIATYLKDLQKACDAIVDQSVASDNGLRISKIFQFKSELATWSKIIIDPQVATIITSAAFELEYSILALSQGQYRHAFKGLRLVLEVCLQAVLLSTNSIKLREWKKNEVDTSWSAITDIDNGIFSHRFFSAFFAELGPQRIAYLNLAKTVYRECSECVHGNTPILIPLPTHLAFDQPTFGLWNDKAETIRLIAHFCLSSRYLRDLKSEDRDVMEPILSEQLGHINEIRTILGELTVS